MRVLRVAGTNVQVDSTAWTVVDVPDQMSALLQAHIPIVGVLRALS